VQHPWLSIEVKHKKIIPLWLLTAMSQAVAAVRGQQLPVVILHQSGARHNDDLVVVRLGDWVQWFGDVSYSSDDSSCGATNSRGTTAERRER
jgi:hypothetical protein